MTAPESRDNPVVQNDPTQTLFSALGRFCRHFTRAQSIPNSPWPDDCMQELTASLRVCLDQNWTSLQQALIDTARVLSSYDRAGRAPECLPFLQKSHDILSLMVGDLILDRVTDLGRYGWTDHYARALTALRDRGIALVDDDTAATAAHPAPVSAPVPPAFVEELPPMPPAESVAAPEVPLPEEPELSVEPEPPAETEEESVAETAAPELAAASESAAAPETAPETVPSAPETTAAAVPETPEPAPVPAPAPAQPTEETVEAINVAMQKAIMSGDVAQAKTLAIRLAAALARREIDTAQHNLAGARDRLGMNGTAIEEGEHRVADAEARVQHAETEIAAREAESQACRERIASLDGEIHARRQEVAELDAQIQELQERRAREAATLHERESERSAAVAGDSLIQTEIESLNEEEDAAREFLEAARAKLDTMRAERIRIEDEITAILDDIERRRRSVRAIERPLFGEDEEARAEEEPAADVQKKPADDGGDDTLLF